MDFPDAPGSPTPGPPSISIVVPNFNAGRTLGAALQSLVDQDYPRLEIIVMDGGSTDGSVEVIKKFESRLAYWESVPDRGQSHAINKGFARASGEVVNWLCSDDLLAPGALQAVGAAMSDPAVGVCIGRCKLVFPDDPALNGQMWPTRDDISNVARRNAIGQPSCFYRRDLLKRVPALLEDYFYAMDQELWCYLLSKGARVELVDCELSVAIQDGRNKTRTADYRFYMEADRIFRAYGGGGRSPTPRWYRWSIRPLARRLESNPGPAQSAAIHWAIDRMGGLQRRWRKLSGRA